MMKFLVCIFTTLGLILVLSGFLPAESENTWPDMIAFAAGCVFLGNVVATFYGKSDE